MRSSVRRKRYADTGRRAWTTSLLAQLPSGVCYLIATLELGFNLRSSEGIDETSGAKRRMAREERVLCKDCLEYPARNRQPGSDLCISVASNRSLDSRPCQPRPRSVVRKTIPKGPTKRSSKEVLLLVGIPLIVLVLVLARLLGGNR